MSVDDDADVCMHRDRSTLLMLLNMNEDASWSLDPILPLIASCFLWKPSQPTPPLTRKYIKGAALFSLIASDHNTVKYAGSEPKAQKKFVTHDYIIYSPATVFLALSSLSLILTFCPSLCFPCSFVRKCFFICFVWLRRETQASRCSRRWERESSHSWCIARP